MNKPKSILPILRQHIYTPGTSTDVATRLKTAMKSLPIATTPASVHANIKDIVRGLTAIKQLKIEQDNHYRPLLQQLQGEIQRINGEIQAQYNGPPNPDANAPPHVPDLQAIGILIAQRARTEQQRDSTHLEQQIDAIIDEPQRELGMSILQRTSVQHNDQDMVHIRDKIMSLVDDRHHIHPISMYEQEIGILIKKQNLLLQTAPTTLFQDMGAFAAQEEPSESANAAATYARNHNPVGQCFHKTIMGICNNHKCDYDHNVKPKEHPQYEPLIRQLDKQVRKIESQQRQIYKLEKELDEKQGNGGERQGRKRERSSSQDRNNKPKGSNTPVPSRSRSNSRSSYDSRDSRR